MLLDDRWVKPGKYQQKKLAANIKAFRSNCSKIEMIIGKSKIDGFINKIKLHFRNAGVPAEKVFFQYDEDKDEQLNLSEMTVMIKEIIEGLDDATCKEIFDEIDVDKDGAIDCDEFLRKML